MDFSSVSIVDCWGLREYHIRVHSSGEYLPDRGILDLGIDHAGELAFGEAKQADVRLFTGLGEGFLKGVGHADGFVVHQPTSLAIF